MADISPKRFIPNENLNAQSIKWFLAKENPAPTSNPAISALAAMTRKVDVLIRVDGNAIDTDLFKDLARHPKVGTLIVFGLPKAQQIAIAILAAQHHFPVRFCDTEDEVRVLMNKRRSRVIAGNTTEILVEGQPKASGSAHLQ